MATERKKPATAWQPRADEQAMEPTSYSRITNFHDGRGVISDSKPMCPVDIGND